MRLRSHRRNLVVWSQSAGSVGRYGAPPFTRRRRIRRWIRTGALLTVVGLMPLARAVRARWRPLLAGGVLTVVGVMWLDGPGGMVLLPGLWLLLSAPLIPASPEADRMRRPEVELERAVFSHPAQRRLAIQAMAAHDKLFPAPDGINTLIQPEPIRTTTTRAANAAHSTGVQQRPHADRSARHVRGRAPSASSGRTEPHRMFAVN